MNLNPPASLGDVSALVIFVAPYVSTPSSENMPKQHSGRRIRTIVISLCVGVIAF